MQKKWVIGAAVSTLSIGVIGVSAAFAAGQQHLSDQSGVTIAGGVQGESGTPLAIDSWQRTGLGGSTQDAKNDQSQQDDQAQSNQHAQNQQSNKPPVQSQAPPPPEQPVVAPPPQPQSVSSVSAASFD